MAKVWNAVVAFFESSGWTAVTFLAVLTGGILIIRILTVLIKKALLKSPLESTLGGFVSAFVQFLLWLLLLFVLAAVAHIPTTPLITAVGAIGLALSLAIKDSLSNLANGLVLMGTKPFKVGDYVDIDSISGTVKAIKMMTTELLTPDNKKVLLPNGKITTAAITNYSAKQTRRVGWDLPVSYDADPKTVQETVLGVLSGHPKILAVPPPEARLAEYGDSSVRYTARAWVKSDDYWDVFWDINEKMFSELNRRNISIPFNQLDVHFFPGGKLPVEAYAALGEAQESSAPAGQEKATGTAPAGGQQKNPDTALTAGRGKKSESTPAEKEGR